MLVLQGNAATKLRCGGKFFILVISYFLLILIVKEFLKSTNICQSYSKNKSGPVFSDSQCILVFTVWIFASTVQCPSVCLSTHLSITLQYFIFVIQYTTKQPTSVLLSSIGVLLAVCPFCHPTDSVKSTDGNTKHYWQPLFWPHTFFVGLIVEG